MKTPSPRQNVYDLYWYFAAERQAIFERRLAGQAAPWTDDPILSSYKFCNVFRASDRVSQYLINDVAYADDAATADDVLFRVLAFRFFSRPETWNAVTTFLRHQPTLDDLATGRFEAALEHAKGQEGKLYTGAFILCASAAYGFSSKHRNHVALFQHMFLQDDLGARLRAAASLEAVYTLLRSYPLIGDFMAYQLAIDLNYTSLLDFDENSFTKAGPGAKRGIAKAFVSLEGHTPEAIILMMVENQDAEFARLGLTFSGLSGRKLHAIDCQGLFCELDKYCREAVPELVSSRSRIKARHQPNSVPVDYHYPPKWALS